MKTNKITRRTSKKCHSRMSLSGIYNACRYHKKKQTLFNKCVEDPRLRPSGMTPLFSNGGFTLIELLVVVLIIGILAAVAVPQYKLAVTKAHIKKMLPIISSIAKADQIYYLANGQYTTNTKKLDISMPASCKVDSSVGDCVGQVWKCGPDFVIDNSAGRWVFLYFCPGQSDNYSTCTAQTVIRIFADATSTIPGNCTGNKKLCNALNLN